MLLVITLIVHRRIKLSAGTANKWTPSQDLNSLWLFLGVAARFGVVCVYCRSIMQKEGLVLWTSKYSTDVTVISRKDVKLATLENASVNSTWNFQGCNFS
jgi:hypothetical protein